MYECSWVAYDWRKNKTFAKQQIEEKKILTSPLKTYISGNMSQLVQILARLQTGSKWLITACRALTSPYKNMIMW